jgi:FKBP-type peptidyl-prolyl cis-trans isomerase 2
MPIIPIAVIVATIVVAASIGTYLVYFVEPHDPAGEDNIIVEAGDVVSVDYVGTFENGNVFDTSIESVAFNDAAYPKALSYELRDTFSPLNFTVGGGQMVKGFDNGVVGMYVGETKEIVVNPADGYGLSDPLKVKEMPIIQQVPVYEYGVSLQNFSDEYGVAATVGVTVLHHFWGWNVTMYSLDMAGGTITLKHVPSVGSLVSPYGGWSSKVESIDESANSGQGKITLRHLLTSADVNVTKGEDASGEEFRVVSVDSEGGTFVADYNKEVVGQVLIFRVTVLSATKSS